jgi:hypothetical protein
VAKAKPKTTTQVLLKDALARVVAEVHAPHYAEQLIKKWIAGGQLPWGYKTREGFRWRGMSPDDMIQVLWKRNPRINWEENSVGVLVTLGGGCFVVYGVWVAAKALDALLASLGSGILDSLLKPKPLIKPDLPESLRGGVARWVYGRMKKDGPRIFEHGYVTELDEQKGKIVASKGRIQNLVGHYRGTEEFQAIRPKEPSGKRPPK